MVAVLTRCPATSKPIETGIEIDEVSFIRLPAFVGRVFCPHCSREHQWSKDAAWVAEER